MTSPATAGPAIRARLNTALLSAIALAIPRRPAASVRDHLAGREKPVVAVAQRPEGAAAGAGWHGAGWHGAGWHGAGWHGAGWHGAGWHGAGWHGAGWHGAGWHGAGWHGA